MKRPPAIEDLIGVWDAQGPYPLRSTHEVAQLVAWVKTLEQRTVAARTHIERARLATAATAAGYDSTLAADTELCAALDVLDGEVDHVELSARINSTDLPDMQPGDSVRVTLKILEASEPGAVSGDPTRWLHDGGTVSEAVARDAFMVGGREVYERAVADAAELNAWKKGDDCG